MIARGRARCGSRTSSPAVDTASSPMNEKKIVAAAALIPAAPAPQKSSKWSPLNAVNPMITNSISTASLMITMTVLTSADSLAPRISSIMHISTSTTAGRLISPVTLSSYGMGEYDSASGSCTPKRLSVSSLKYPLQPTATAELETPYSSRTQAAITIAMNSPSAW